MAVLAVTLVVVAVGGSLLRPRRIPAFVFPALAGAAAIATGLIGWREARHAVSPLNEPIAFLLLAVPLAALLDELEVFDAAAALIGGRAICAGLWILTAVTVAVLNLDAAVVLVTPLAVKVATRWHLDPVALAFQPALLACLASSALPASNLTNLIAAADHGLGPIDLLTRLGLPTLAATVVGYGGWRVAFHRRNLRPQAVSGGPARPARRPLLIGAGVLVALLVGFVPLGIAGVPAWAVVGVVDIALVLLAWHLPWRAVPWQTAVVVAGLAVTVRSLALHTDAAEWITVRSRPLQVLVSAGAANVMNNLPAFLLPLGRIHGKDHLAAHLLGVNAGPLLLVTGSLSGLLWLESAHRSGLAVTWRSYLRVGVTAGIPALLAATAVFWVR